MDLNACDLNFLEKRFRLVPVIEADFIQQWLNSPAAVTKGETFQAVELRNLLKENVLHWNEQELSLHFIGPLFSIVHFTIVTKMNLFAQRFISADIADYTGDFITLSGKPDGLLASGYRSPEIPYFCFQEYKREKDPTGDPSGQCLAAMLVGQTQNGDINQPIYGCYVVGQNWYFLVLQGRQYAISAAYSAITDEIFYILGLLKTLKANISAIIDARVSDKR
jgi:hypothetical protein